MARVQLPVLYPAIYLTLVDSLWTDAVMMTHRTFGDGANVQVQEGALADARPAARSRDPRETSRGGGLTTSLSSAAGALFEP